MARATLTPDSVTGKYPTAGELLTETVANAVDGNQFVLTGREILIARNTHATDPFTVIISSVAHPTTGRTGNITTTLAAGESWMWGPLGVAGWSQTTGYLYFIGETTDIVFQLIQLPG